MLGQGDFQALGDGTQHWVNKRHLTSGNPRDVATEEQAGQSNSSQPVVGVVPCTHPTSYNSFSMAIALKAQDLLGCSHPLPKHRSRSA
jgi:hypothetical protein